MLKGNLATRPFYNERLVNGLLILAALGALALSAYAASRVVDLWGERSRVVALQQAAEDEAARVSQTAAAESQRVNQTALRMLGASTREANALIDERTFSWTVFFSLIERTLPLDVRLVAVAPRVERGVTRIIMIVNAKRPSDLAAFLEALQATGSFYDLLPTDQQQNEDGTFSATVATSYVPPAAGVPKTKSSGAAGGSERP
jgi:hypothetical protein